MTRAPGIGVGGIALTQDAILLIRRGKPPFEGKWSIPGGTLEAGETIEQALRREFWEETGLNVRVGRLAGIVESIDPAGEYHYVILDYFVAVLGGAPAPGGDASDVRWVPLAHLNQLPTTPKLLGSLKEFRVIT